jgi:hypothetical protein
MNRDAKKVIRAEFVCEPMQALAVVQDNSINYQKVDKTSNHFHEFIIYIFFVLFFDSIIADSSVGLL